jgi:hypothetical protein
MKGVLSVLEGAISSVTGQKLESALFQEIGVEPQTGLTYTNNITYK